MKDMQQLLEKEKLILLHKFLQFATNSDVMSFGMAKLAASTFGRLRVGTHRVYL